MEHALNVTGLNSTISDRYERSENRIVGIMLARYDLPLTQAIIDSCYLYWHYNTDKTLDIFWAGYGKYLCPDEASNDKIILKFDGNQNNVYYDRRAFISIKNEFNNIFKKPYQDKIELVLVNYRDGKLRFNESMKIDLEENLDPNFATIRELMEFITNECSHTYNVASLAGKIRSERFKDYVKRQIKGITFSDIISAAIGIASL
ncbi:MAG: hypothetical protein IJ489_02860 [Clostridia bacterium]|nr:hypothetical protein [Clostridia bacterium]